MLMKSYLEFFLTKNNKKIWAKKIQIIDGKFMLVISFQIVFIT